MIGRPSTKTFLSIVNKNQLKNCPVTEIDILNAEKLYGPNIGSLKGKTVRRPGDPVSRVHTNVDRGIMESHRDVTLCIDIMFVN